MKIALKVDGRTADVTNFLFGYSPRVMIPNGLLPKEAIKQIVRQLAGTKGRVFGASLSVISEEASVREGDTFLRLSPCSKSLRKYIVQITFAGNKEIDWGKDPKLASTVSYQYIWPEWVEGMEGFVPLNDFSISDGISGLYLKWDGPLPKVNHRPSFFEELDRLASDFFSLAECWALCYSIKAREDRTVDAGSILVSWEEGFARKHGNTFLHKKIRYFLESVHLYGEIPRGINTIYDNRSWRLPADLISPLLEQMQNDILEILLENESLIKTVLHTGSPYWRKKMKVIFERYYGVKCLEPFASQQAKRRSGTSSSQKRLEVLERLILRPEMPAEGQIALYLWEQIAGRSYAPSATID